MLCMKFSGQTDKRCPEAWQQDDKMVVFEMKNYDRLFFHDLNFADFTPRTSQKHQI